MKRTLTSPATMLALLTVLALQPGSTRAAGPLTPPGAPAPTMKTLQEIEPRTLISSLPYTISAPGSYYLSTNLSVTTGDGIDINASGVTLDLNGFTISSTATFATGSGILIPGATTDISIRNGSIQGGVTNNGSGTFSGAGFTYGIYGPNAANVRVSNVSVSGVFGPGIWLGNYSSVVQGCTVVAVGGDGISATVVAGCSAHICGGEGISGNSVSGCSGYSYGVGISGTSVINSWGFSLKNGGIYGSEVENSYGSTYTSNYYGIIGFDVNNCYGYGGQSGVYAYDTARGCYGSSSYGSGVSAQTAESCYGETYAVGNYASPYAGVSAVVVDNCYGYSYSSSIYTYGIDAEAAHNCYGYGYYGAGCNVYPGTAENCFGSSTNDFGIYATTANNCYGVSQFSDGLVANTANNCYGISLVGYYGVDCTQTANNCCGVVNGGIQSGYGIYATCANSCDGINYGTGAYGRGIEAYTVANSYGYCTSSSASGIGIEAPIAIGSYGSCYGTSGIGLSATLANSCLGSGTTSSSVTYRYNMP